MIIFVNDEQRSVSGSIMCRVRARYSSFILNTFFALIEAPGGGGSSKNISSVHLCVGKRGVMGEVLFLLTAKS